MGLKRNRLLEQARGEFIAFVDDDDDACDDCAPLIVQAIRIHSNIDCLGIVQQIIFAEGVQRRCIHSLQYRKYFSRGGVYYRPRALEDIELGYRLHQAGYRIFLAKHIQLTHCKYYSFPGLLTSDVFHRAIPWTRIMLEKRIYRSDLNTKGHNVLSVVLAFLILFLLPLMPFYPASVALFVGLWAVLGVLNADFYRFVFREKGRLFLLQTMVMTWFAYIYSGAGLILGILIFLITPRK